MSDRLPHVWDPDAREPAVCLHCTVPRGDEGVPGEECAVRLRHALSEAVAEVPRHAKRAIQQATHAFGQGDLARLGTVLEDIQPLVDAAIGYHRREAGRMQAEIVDLRAQADNARTLLEQCEALAGADVSGGPRWANAVDAVRELREDYDESARDNDGLLIQTGELYEEGRQAGREEERGAVVAYLAAWRLPWISQQVAAGVHLPSVPEGKS